MIKAKEYRTNIDSHVNLSIQSGSTAEPTLIFGSAPSALALESKALSNIQTVAINNAWRIRPDIDFAVYASDFPETRRPPLSWPGRQISGPEYSAALAAPGGELLCGATMAFVAGYWACETLRPPVLGFYGCDMTYCPSGNTHFYGTGRPDPLREHISLRSLEAKAMRLFCWGLKRGITIVNCSRSPVSRLVFPRMPVSGLGSFRPSIEHWRPLLAQAAKLYEMEKKPPFSRFRRDVLDWPETENCRAIVDRLDRYWLDLIPLMDEIAVGAGLPAMADPPPKLPSADEAAFDPAELDA